jgi:hypothetical protein
VCLSGTISKGYDAASIIRRRVFFWRPPLNRAYKSGRRDAPSYSLRERLIFFARDAGSFSLFGLDIVPATARWAATPLIDNL